MMIFMPFEIEIDFGVCLGDFGVVAQRGGINAGA